MGCEHEAIARISYMYIDVIKPYCIQTLSIGAVAFLFIEIIHILVPALMGLYNVAATDMVYLK